MVDDDHAFARAFERTVERNCRVITATSLGAAERDIAEHDFDLAVVDLRLSDGVGLDLVPKIKQRQAAVAVVSGYLSVAFTVAALRAGADLVLFKPVTAPEILRQLEEDDAQSTAKLETPSLARAEWEHITRVLTECQGNISMAARRLGIYRQSLQRRLRKYAPRE